jgi:hypothetical protein
MLMAGFLETLLQSGFFRGQEWLRGGAFQIHDLLIDLKLLDLIVKLATCISIERAVAILLMHQATDVVSVKAAQDTSFGGRKASLSCDMALRRCRFNNKERNCPAVQRSSLSLLNVSGGVD